MRFTPKSDKEIAEQNLLAKGEYDYEVVEASEGRSKSGNDMIVLKVRVFHGESERVITDYLLEAMAGKLKHFCDQHGLQREYEQGTLAAGDCHGRMGKALVGIEKDRTGNYPDKNRILDYVVPKAGAAKTATNGGPYDADPNDSDVPF